MDWYAIPVGLLPVLLFLLALRMLDSFKLVTRADTVAAIGIGAAAALAALSLNSVLLSRAGLDPIPLRRYVAPALEETLKALYVFHLIRRARVGFTVDAAFHGFAIGTGFALVENVYYAWAEAGGGLALWLVRGLGTAVMHGSTTAIVAIVGKVLTDRRGRPALASLLPGLAVAVLLHSLFNHFVLDPLLSTAVLLGGMPVLLLAVFERSERATQEWLGTGMDDEVEVLESIVSGRVSETHIGAYLTTLRERFPGAVVGDMLCCLQIHLELAIRAKGILLARSAGIDLPVGDDVRANFEELHFLKRSIGPTGVLAISPLLHTSSRDLWQIYMLGSEARRKGRRAGRERERGPSIR
jgi:RsiW-degrading membrane proteinase PrsW (M82 family)